MTPTKGKMKPRIENIDCVKQDVVNLLRNRSSYCCDHCERQYDDDICNKCFVDMIFRELIIPHIKAITAPQSTNQEELK